MGQIQSWRNENMNMNEIMELKELSELRSLATSLLEDSTKAFEHVENYSQLLKVTEYQKHFSSVYDGINEILRRPYGDEHRTYKRLEGFVMSKLDLLNELKEEWDEVNQALLCQFDTFEIARYRAVAKTGPYTNGLPEEYVYFFDKFKGMINEMFSVYDKLVLQETYKVDAPYFSGVVWESIIKLSRVFQKLRQLLPCIQESVARQRNADYPSVQELGAPKHWAEAELSWMSVKEHAEQVLRHSEPKTEPITRTEIIKKLVERGEIIENRLNPMMDTEIIENVKKVATMMGRYSGLYAAILLADAEKSDEVFKKKTDRIAERLEILEADSIELATELGYMV